MGTEANVSNTRTEPVARSPSSTSSTASAASSSARPSITQEINLASRPYHTHLNKTIVARLPLAIPPHTEDPLVYAEGIRHMLPVYHAFESSWARYISVEARTPKAEDLTLQEAVLTSMLVHLNIPQLARADRLRSDLTDLLGIGLGELEAWVMEVSGVENLSNSVLYDERDRIRPTEESFDGDIDDEDPEALAASSILSPLEPEYPELRSFVRHIHYVTRTKPHTLIAYAFVFYMALFNGGRWLRAQLSKARESWQLSPKTTTEDTNKATDKDEAGLSFWYFEGDNDGEDIKEEFKARLQDIDHMLDDVQRKDVIEESVYIFQACGRLITELDEMMAGPEHEAETEYGASDMQDSFMIRSELLKPRAEAPWRYLELIFRYLLPLGLFDLLILAVNGVKRVSRHFWPALRWTWDDTSMAAKTK